MLAEFKQQLSRTLEEIKSQGLYKTERIITTPQDAHIGVADGKRVLNMCANNYLGLAEKYTALTMIDDAHATGFLGKTGRGTHEYRGVMGKIDIITGTLGKALGGASGGFTSGRKEIVDLLRQRSRPYLFSNTIAPPVVAASLKALELLSASTELRDKLEENTKYFRAALTERGLTIKPGVHPIVPIMIGDAAKSQKFAARMLEKGVYVIGFFYPVVPHGTARVRTQVSAAHSREDLEFAVNAFAETNEELNQG